MAPRTVITLPLVAALAGFSIAGSGTPALGAPAPTASAVGLGGSVAPSPVPVAAPADTAVTVRAGDRVRLELGEGRVVVEGTTGDRLEVHDPGRSDPVAVVRRGSELSIRPRSRDGEMDGVIRLRVPPGVPVEVMGRSLDVEASGLEGSLRVQVVEGELRAVAIRGAVELRTVDGDVEIDDVVGDVVAATVDGEVRVSGVRGRVAAESMDGDVTLIDVDGAAAEATTVDGDVLYRGPLTAGSRVRLVTHDGDVTAEVPPGASAEVEVSTWDGEFLPAFPVRVGRVQAGQPLRFTMGSGAARLEMQVFDGDIQLRHGPGR